MGRGNWGPDRVLGMFDPAAAHAFVREERSKRELSSAVLDLLEDATDEVERLRHEIKRVGLIVNAALRAK